MKKILFLILSLSIPFITFANWPWINCYWLPGCWIKSQWLDDFKTDNSALDSWVKYLTNVISDSIKYVAVFSVLAIIISWIYFVASAGNEDKAKRAKKYITWSILWVLISTSAWSMVNILNKFKFEDSAEEQKVVSVDHSVTNDWTTPEINLDKSLKVTKAQALDKYTILVKFNKEIIEDLSTAPYIFKLTDLKENEIWLSLEANEVFEKTNMKITTQTELQKNTDYKIVVSWVKSTDDNVIEEWKNDTIYFTTPSSFN